MDKASKAVEMIVYTGTGIGNLDLGKAVQNSDIENTLDCNREYFRGSIYNVVKDRIKKPPSLFLNPFAYDYKVSIVIRERSNVHRR